MAQKIMFLCGSPIKDGNTRIATEWVAEAARAAGARVEIIDVAGLKSLTNGCTSCLGCQKSEKYECVFDDAISAVLRRMPEQDMLVFATPLYCFGPTAQLKILIDRMFCLEKIDMQTGKFTSRMKHIAIGLIATAGGNSFHGLKVTFREACRFSRQRYCELLIPFAGGSGELKNNADARRRAQTFGAKLARF